MSIRELTCIGCPMGCQLTAVLENGQVTRVTGNTCPRGTPMPGRSAPTRPHRHRHRPGVRRRAAGGVRPHRRRGAQGEGAGRGSGAVPGASHGPVAAGDVVIPNVLGTGVDVVATRSV